MVVVMTAEVKRLFRLRGKFLELFIAVEMGEQGEKLINKNEEVVVGAAGQGRHVCVTRAWRSRHRHFMMLPLEGHDHDVPHVGWRTAVPRPHTPALPARGPAGRRPIRHPATRTV